MIAAIAKNLQRGIQLLNSITEMQYKDQSIPPYYSSIGTHMRHVLDMFTCIFDGMDDLTIDFTNRKRNEHAEQYIADGLHYFEITLQKLEAIKDKDLNQLVYVIDDLGLGKVTMKYTLQATLAQANSHAIHHFATIGFIIHQLGIALPDKDFGYNPTSPRLKLQEEVDR